MSKRVRSAILKAQAVLNRYCAEHTNYTNQGLKALSEEALYEELSVMVGKVSKFRILLSANYDAIDEELMDCINKEYQLLYQLIRKVTRPPK